MSNKGNELVVVKFQGAKGLNLFLYIQNFDNHVVLFFFRLLLIKVHPPFRCYVDCVIVFPGLDKKGR